MFRVFEMIRVSSCLLLKYLVLYHTSGLVWGWRADWGRRAEADSERRQRGHLNDPKTSTRPYVARGSPKKSTESGRGV